MFSKPLPSGQAPRTPLNDKKIQNQNNLAYRASEKSRLGKVEEVGSFEIFYLHCLVCGQYSDRIHLVLNEGISQIQLAVKACAKYDKKEEKSC